jgi:nucleoside-diphosphate-sugar epimerase
VGAHVAKAFLDHGWIVIGTVRDAQKGTSLLKLPVFSQFAKERKIEFTVVEDISTADFKSVLSGVDALAHTASPFHFDGQKFTDYGARTVFSLEFMWRICYMDTLNVCV